MHACIMHQLQHVHVPKGSPPLGMMMWLRLQVLRIAFSRRCLYCFVAICRFLVKETSES
jgi:hypothetical protein